MKTIAILFLFVSVSCAKVQLSNEAKKDYRLGIEINIDNMKAEGILSVPFRSSYPFRFETDEKIDFISFKTCSREVTAQDPRTGLNRKRFDINYTPNEIERNRGCPALINAYNEAGMFETGHIVFPLPVDNLPAVSICGGQEVKNNGASICQGRIESIEKISFDVEVLTSADADCPLFIKRGKEFIYNIPRGYCLFVFKETKAPFRVHRLTTYGYTDIQVRK